MYIFLMYIFHCLVHIEVVVNIIHKCYTYYHMGTILFCWRENALCEWQYCGPNTKVDANDHMIGIPLYPILCTAYFNVVNVNVGIRVFKTSSTTMLCSYSSQKKCINTDMNIRCVMRTKTYKQEVINLLNP